MICVPFPLIWWHCTRQLLTPRAPALPSASVREATCSLIWVIQQYSGSIPVSSQQLICVWKGGELQKWEVPRKATQLFSHVFDRPPEVPVIMGALFTLPQSVTCLPKPREPSVSFFLVFFRSTSLKKEQRCFPKEWTAFCHLFQTWFRGNPVLLFAFVVPLESEQ